MLPKPDCERGDVDERVDLEHVDKECPEMVENLCEKVPEKPNIGRQVRDTQEKPVGGSEKFPRCVLDIA